MEIGSQQFLENLFYEKEREETHKHHWGDPETERTGEGLVTVRSCHYCDCVRKSVNSNGRWATYYIIAGEQQKKIPNCLR